MKPHMHPGKYMIEKMHLISGSFKLIFFDEKGTPKKIYNIDKRFGKLYTQTHDVKGTGLKESIENNNYRITKFLK